jgi:hypothetical protein
MTAGKVHLSRLHLEPGALATRDADDNTRLASADFIALSMAISAKRQAEALEKIAEAIGAWDGEGNVNWWLRQIADEITRARR